MDGAIPQLLRIADAHLAEHCGIEGETLSTLWRTYKLSKYVRSLEDKFRNSFAAGPASRATYRAAKAVCQAAFKLKVRIDPALFDKLTFAIHDRVLDEKAEINAALKMAYEPTVIAKEYGTYIVATAKTFGFTRAYDRCVDDVLDNGAIVDLCRAIASTPDIYFGEGAIDGIYDPNRRSEARSTALLLYTSMIASVILETQMDPDNDYMIYEHARGNVRSFLACMGIVDSYVCVGGEDLDAPSELKSDNLVDVMSTYFAVEHVNGRYWAFRHACARFFRARWAARLIQRRWRKYMRVRNNVRKLHMINKYARYVPVLPAEVVRAIAVRGV